MIGLMADGMMTASASLVSDPGTKSANDLAIEMLGRGPRSDHVRRNGYRLAFGGVSFPGFFVASHLGCSIMRSFPFENRMMNIDDSPLATFLKSVLSIEEQESGAYEDPSRPPAAGKWSEPGVPHKGWHVVDYYKRDDREHLCEMCERQLVMFVHVMRHDSYPDELKVGCVCAAHMENDLEGARHARCATGTSGSAETTG